MKPLHILITNNALANYAGTELYVRDVAFHLKKKGHLPVIYSQILGRLSDEIRAEGIPVVNDLKQMTHTPDIIHGHHNLEVMTALCFFPNTPAIFICHGFLPWQEHPPLFPRILRYLAVDQPCLERLYENGIPSDRAEMVLNCVDLQRFTPRKPLPPFPRKALVFNNSLNKDNGLSIILKACRLAGIEGDVAGLRSGSPCFQPEKLLPEYDLVFAKGRAALEALAVGCAVVTCDRIGLGTLVRQQNYHALRQLNFGFRTLPQPLTMKGILTQISHYDPQDAQEVSQRVREEADLERIMERLIACYQSVIEEFKRDRPSREAEEKALANYFGWLGSRVKGLIREPATSLSYPSPASPLLQEVKRFYHKLRNFIDLKIEALGCLRISWGFRKAKRKIRLRERRPEGND